MDHGLGGSPYGGFHALGNFAGLTNSRPVEPVSSPGVRNGLALPASRSGLAEAGVVGPIITPLPESSSTRNEVIEAWPHRSQAAAIPSFARQNASPAPGKNLPVAPSNETPFSAIEPAPAATSDDPAVPSLLPPGP